MYQFVVAAAATAVAVRTVETKMLVALTQDEMRYRFPPIKISLPTSVAANAVPEPVNSPVAAVVSTTVAVSGVLSVIDLFFFAFSEPNADRSGGTRGREPS